MMDQSVSWKETDRLKGKEPVPGSFPLAVSNIGWPEEWNTQVYERMKAYGFTGLEIAPTKLLKEQPYDRIPEARKMREELADRYGLSIPSMQSIWYGRQEGVFGSEEEKQVLLDYTKKAIDFAGAIGCKNLVFGCPRNRSVPEGVNADTALPFFQELGRYAKKQGTVLAMEANPPMYHTNFINTTKEALDFLERNAFEGWMLNLDVGTMIANGESIDVLAGREKWIHHVHVSEPGLKKIEKRALHQELSVLLRDAGYPGYVSIETSGLEDPEEIAAMMDYVRGIFG